MPESRENNGIVTQITTVKLPPGNQSEVLALMTERARFMAMFSCMRVALRPQITWPPCSICSGPTELRGIFHT